MANKKNQHKSFLEMVAEDLHKRFGNDLSEVALVFPNKRAQLFFNDYLSMQEDAPIWSPAFVNIDSLLSSGSQLQVADPIMLVCMLYRIYIDLTGSKESLDDFYFWGELLVADFDDLDKQLVDADKLFRNLEELQELDDDLSWLDDEQREAIAQFFKNFDMANHSELKDRFISIWSHLHTLYHSFRDQLREQEMGYQGMIYRDSVEQMDLDALPYKHYALAGFNVLNKVEKKLFKQLHDADLASFYWDYDLFYMENLDIETMTYSGINFNHEAGVFIRENLINYPNQLTKEQLNVLNQKKEIDIINTNTENAQARFVGEWGQRGLLGQEKDNAVVLCNEALLQPVMYALPNNIEQLNITMGYPLKQTPIYSLVQAITELHIRGYRKKRGDYRFQTVLQVLNHPYTQRMSPEADRIVKMINEQHLFYPTISLLLGTEENEFLHLLFSPVDTSESLCRLLIEVMQKLSILFTNPSKDETNALDNTSADDSPIPEPSLFSPEEMTNQSPTDQPTQSTIFRELYTESIYQCYTKVNRILDLIKEKELIIKPSTLSILINRILSTTKIPFHGEPAVGLQVLGVLETRNLDFRNLLILSLNEGNLPKKPQTASFIPYNLRKGFGMTTLEHHNAVFAYYFYRMIQRAERITMLYSTATDGMNRGESSRFIQQLLADWPHPVKRHYIEAKQTIIKQSDIEVKKTPQIIDFLHRTYNLMYQSESKGDLQERFIHIAKQMEKPYDQRKFRQGDAVRILSPSAMNIYINCSLKFYFKYIAHLSVDEEVSEDIDARIFGLIFHEAAELIYNDLCSANNVITADTLDKLLENPIKIRNYVDQSFAHNYFNITDGSLPEYNGIQLINAQAINKYIRTLLEHDKKRTPFHYVASEKYIAQTITIDCSHTQPGDKARDTTSQASPTPQLMVATGGYIDRMDWKDGTLRIVDYKTGGKSQAIKEAVQLITPDPSRPKHAFQVFVYSNAMIHYLHGVQNKATGFSYLTDTQGIQKSKISPCLYYTRESGRKDYDPSIQLSTNRKRTPLDDFEDMIKEDFEVNLKEIIRDIFDPNKVFSQCDDISGQCAYCDFKDICNR